MRHDPILELMKRRWTAAEEVESLTERLAAAQRVARASADALFDAQTKKANRLLCELMQAENRPRGKGRPGARKGAKRGSP